MRLLMLSDVYFPRVNGVSTSIRTFADWLVRRGHEVALVAPDYGPGSGQEVVDAAAGFRIIRVPARVIPFDPEDRFMRRRPVDRLVAELGTEGWDAVHCHTPFRAHRLAVGLRRRHRLRVVESYHTYFEEYVAHYLPLAPAGLLRWFARYASRRLCAEVDHLIVPSRQMVSVLRRYGIDMPHSVLPTGIELSEFRSGDGAAFRARHGIPADAPVMVTVSRLAVEKNIGFLLEVARRVRERFPDLRFLIAGEGPDGPRLRRRASELGLDGCVHFFGNLERRTSLLDAYRAGDAFVFASPTETQGLVLIEAMALGVPIVSTAVMGTATVLEGAGSALVAEANVDDFSAKLATLLADPALRGRLSAAGAADAERWGSDRLMGEAEALYRELVARGPYPLQVARV
ncbi:glycosyltransferase [Pseudomarimonas salicorniae]|uniref:Glycosyltransferase n=1 Tax=Pseudomarimonas salicorniae TaxID=2933270 RepID=A0ABT0GGS9_9GAMM|nr:glycosyltransferase [Lysobacter sp. CAU 1642]MCK7593731.1 glycosyltransferase [Lysobacter sp. CAU 1642]